MNCNGRAIKVGKGCPRSLTCLARAINTLLYPETHYLRTDRHNLELEKKEEETKGKNIHIGLREVDIGP